MESPALRFLYRTIPGRAMLKLLTRPGLSRLAGRYLDSRASRWLIPRAMRAWGVDMDEFVPEDFASFNAFFTRRRRPERVRIDPDPARLISPCDGLLSACEIDPDRRLRIKGWTYRLDELLGDAALAERFRGGACLIFRLTPANYHRYCHIADGVAGPGAAIPGELHCVRPIACERYPVYARNSREYVQIRTDRFGLAVQMEVGALLVGRIVNERLAPGERVRRGQEKGRFEFGGSTVVVLLEAGRAALDARVSDASRRGEELPVRLGEGIGTAAE